MIRWGLLAAASASALVGAPSAAYADEYTADTPGSSASSVPPQQRVFGIGTAVGGGVSAANIVSWKGDQGFAVAPALLLPTTELQVFFPREYSLDLVVPIANIIVASAALGGFYFNMDAYFNLNANIGEGNARCVLGPGLGFSVLTADSGRLPVSLRRSAASLRLPAQIGLELLSMKRGFGFKIVARPWVEFASGGSASAVGGGVLGAIAFSGYITRDAPETTASR